MRRIVIGLLCLFAVGGLTSVRAQEMNTGRLERSEMRFLEGMSDHHQMALDMANAGLQKAATPAVVELMQAVIAAQTPEIEQMRAWLLDWYHVEYTVMGMAGMMHMEMSDEMRTQMEQMSGMMDMMMGMDMSGHTRAGMESMRGMMDMMMGGMGGGSMDHGGMAMTATDPAMMMGMFAGFSRLEGVEYEIAWLEAMIDHHDDALHMSERLLARGVVHEELGAFAQAIIDAQTAEIAQMETLLEELVAQ